jgi:hypothetical protein
MGRILIICVLAIVLAAPLAAQASGSGSGTLSVKNATGAVAVAARGVLLGHCDRCTVTITNPNPLDDGSSRVVQPLSVLRTPLSDTKTAYQGNDLRFKLIGGFFRVRIVGTGIDVSVVADGNAVLDEGTAGTYSRNGDQYLPMPAFKVPLQINGA